MPMAEIDEAELLRLRRVEGTLGAIIKNPVAKKALARAVKEVNPEDPLAKEADRVDPIDARFDALSQQNADLKKQIDDDKSARERDARLGVLKSEQEKGFAALRAEKWTDDGIEKVRKVMEEKGILDVAIAAKWVESQMPLQNPINSAGSGAWSFMEAPKEDNDIKALIESKGENTSLLHKMAQDAIAEVRGTSRR